MFKIRCIILFPLTSEPLGGVRNLQVTNPTTSTLDVQWEPAEGNVRQYKVNFVPAAGGEQKMVIRKTVPKHQSRSSEMLILWLQKL